MTTFATNVPQPVLGPTGYVLPTEAQILAGVIADFQAAFGGNLNLSINNPSSLTTPQGQLATTLAAIIADNNEVYLSYVAQTDPQYAQGIMQDALGSLYFMNRIPAQGTTVTATCMGLANTTVPTGTNVAQDAAGNLYTCAGFTIPSTGQISAVFTNSTTGPITYVSPLSIYQTIPGWDGFVGSPVQTLLGVNVESTQAFEYRRQASVALNAGGTTAAVKAAILASGASLAPPQVPTSVYCVENPTGATVTQGGITLPPNSLYVCVYGGNQNAIASAIWCKKSLGCNYVPTAIFTGSISAGVLTVNSISSGFVAKGQTVAGGGVPVGITITGGSGNTWTLSNAAFYVALENLTSATTTTVYDAAYATPQPSYQVSYTVPLSAPINMMVTVAAASNPPSNALALLSDAITGLGMAFSGADGLVPVTQIGQTVYSSRFYPTIATILPGAAVVNLQLGATACSFTGTISDSTLTVSSVLFGALAIGQSVFGPSVLQGSSMTNPPPTIIGGSGSVWTLSSPCAISTPTAMSSATMTYQQSININQIPLQGSTILVLV
jgi:hypothetical protein